MSQEDRTCRFCGEPGFKRRIQILPWKYECIYVCRADMPKIIELITALRKELES